ncbi:hypothetical protein DFJ67_1501 [Asanoa ferruginea]|uniref:Uncharacterized protein n=1 Tax=Asanoa ferruginea TaxID=53367 RepID=A0A3D9ZGH3_9ACTN|nr:hypothetical protein DFJ67_1501 [Asanoa ferruginea]
MASKRLRNSASKGEQMNCIDLKINLNRTVIVQIVILILVLKGVIVL